MSKEKLAVCVVLKNELGQILAVSRKDDHSKFGLPGGKLDEGEDFPEAAVREVKEETGLDINNLKFLLEVVDDCGYFVRCYCADYVGDLLSEEDLAKIGETGLVKWVGFDVLFEGPFKEYNKMVFSELNK